MSRRCAAPSIDSEGFDSGVLKKGPGVQGTPPPELEQNVRLS